MSINACAKAQYVIDKHQSRPGYRDEAQSLRYWKRVIAREVAAAYRQGREDCIVEMIAKTEERRKEWVSQHSLSNQSGNQQPEEQIRQIRRSVTINGILVEEKFSNIDRGKKFWTYIDGNLTTMNYLEALDFAAGGKKESEVKVEN